jgi:hypothetical protein
VWLAAAPAYDRLVIFIPVIQRPVSAVCCIGPAAKIIIILCVCECNVAHRVEDAVPPVKGGVIPFDYILKFAYLVELLHDPYLDPHPVFLAANVPVGQCF